MIKIGATDIHLAAPAMSRGMFEAYSTQLFDEWDERLASEFGLDDYSLKLAVEEGSVDVLAVIAATLGALYGGIASYPSFLEGLQKIRGQVRDAGDYLAKRANAPFAMSALQPRITRRDGLPAQLQRLFTRVRRRELSVEDAMRDAERLVGADAALAPEFMRALAGSLGNVRRIPEQLFLPMELPEECAVLESKDRSRATKAVKPPPPPSQQLRVEVWRESRTGKRQVRITEL